MNTPLLFHITRATPGSAPPFPLPPLAHTHTWVHRGSVKRCDLELHSLPRHSGWSSDSGPPKFARGHSRSTLPFSLSVLLLQSPFHLLASSVPICLTLNFSCRLSFSFPLTTSPFPIFPHPITINTQKFFCLQR